MFIVNSACSEQMPSILKKDIDLMRKDKGCWPNVDWKQRAGGPGPSQRTVAITQVQNDELCRIDKRERKIFNIRHQIKNRFTVKNRHCTSLIIHSYLNFTSFNIFHRESIAY